MCGCSISSLIEPATGRGGGWVIAQFGVMAVILVAAFLPPQWPTDVRPTLVVVGVVLFIVGIGFAFAAARAMGSSFTPFPSPTGAGTLVERGPFRVVRHPIYSGGLLVFAGVSLATSLPALVGTAVLACVWVGKLRVEETHLRATYAGYDAYAQRVRFRLVPGLY
jgi:protein-S-isoprenylcysteine O-methyltransferase Ste14